MIAVNIVNTYTSCSGLWQYDYGQILCIQGLDLPTAVEIHFSLQEKGGETITRIGMSKDGATDVVIPDSLLENNNSDMDYKIFVFVYLTDERTGHTEYKIAISVKSRPKPQPFDKPENAELFREAIKEVNASAEMAQTAAKEAEDNVKAQESKVVQSVIDEGTKQIKAVSNKAMEQIGAVNTTGSKQVSTIETKGADQVKAIQKAGENALQNIGNGVDKGLSEEGKAADAKATGEAISKLTEDIVSQEHNIIVKQF